MATLTHDCPHCDAKSSTFNATNSVKNQVIPHTWSVHLVCNSCWTGIVAIISDGGTGIAPTDHPANLRLPDHRGYKFEIREIFPKVLEVVVPDHLPDGVARAFKEGCDILKVAPNAACGAFRRTLELALKDLSPEVEAWKLEKRIDKMANAGALTPALQNWAHKLRLDGNSAVHEENVTSDYAREVESLTRFVLTYLFTLPESVKLAQSTE